MNKKLIAALIAITLAVPTTAQAAGLKNRTDSKPAVAILDTGIDTSLPAFQGKIVQEVCILEWTTCPNGQSFMEGPGAASMPAAFITKNGFDHGTLMADQAIQTNPNVNIVFIRIIGQRENGAREYTTEATVFNALQWVADNQAKFNIQSVAMAQGSHYLGAEGTDYCPKTPTTVAKVKALNSMNVGVFFPAGNNRDYQRIDWPACIPETIAVGATMPDNSVASYSNHDALLVDFHARGTTVLYGLDAKKTNFAGSSASVLVGATSWATVKAAKSQLGYTDLYNLLLKTSTPTKNSKIAKANLINLQAALNG